MHVVARLHEEPHEADGLVGGDAPVTPTTTNIAPVFQVAPLAGWSELPSEDGMPRGTGCRGRGGSRAGGGVGRAPPSARRAGRRCPAPRCVTVPAATPRAASPLSRRARRRREPGRPASVAGSVGGMCTVVIHVPRVRVSRFDCWPSAMRSETARGEDSGRGGRSAAASSVCATTARAVRGSPSTPGAGRLAVLLNRDDLSGRPDHEVVSRGGIPLDAVGSASRTVRRRAASTWSRWMPRERISPSGTASKPGARGSRPAPT